jgi:hypothetical protein
MSTIIPEPEDKAPAGFVWEISPHTNPDHDSTITDENQIACRVAQDLVEALWDGMGPGDERTVTIKLRKRTSEDDEILSGEGE